MSKRILIFLFLISLLFLGAACGIKIKTSFDGGLYLSVNKGESWIQKANLLSIKREEKISGVDILSLAIDPQDSQALYIGTKEDGLFYSYDGANSWQSAFRLPKEKVNLVLVDPKDKCTIYAVLSNRVFKSNDCSRNWKNIYLEPNSKITINSLAVDYFNSQRIYLGLSDGRLILSQNGGATWALIKNFDQEILEILVNPKNPSIIYLGTNSNLYRSPDKGKTWISLKENFKDFPGADRFKFMVFNPTKEDSIIFVSDYGILRTDNGGQSWFEYKLLAKRTGAITSLAINPKNPEEIYYTTQTAFYKSSDGGKNWRVKDLPFNRIPRVLLVNFDNPNILYLGGEKIKQ